MSEQVQEIRFYDYMDSPVGELEIAANGHGLLSVLFTKTKRSELPRRPLAPNAITEKTKAQMQLYFDGGLQQFDIPLSIHGTEFQSKVWQELCTIPFAKTISYLTLARQLGDEKCIRAAASANGKNPFAIIVPCHRVIGNSGKLVGYAGDLWRKQWLLEHELKTTGAYHGIFFAVMKKIVHLLLFSLLLCAAKAPAQGSIEATYQRISRQKNDTAKLRLLVQITEECEMNDIIKYASPAVELADKLLAAGQDNEQQILNYKSSALNNLGVAFKQQGELEKAHDFFNKSLKIKEQINDQHGVAEALHNIGDAYLQEGNISSAIEQYQLSLAIQEKIHDRPGASSTLHAIGIMYNRQGVTVKALEYLHRALKIQEDLGDRHGIAASFNVIGSAYHAALDYPQALAYYQKSLELNEELQDKLGTCTVLNNIGSLYQHQHNVDGALGCYLKGLALAEALNDPGALSSSYYRIGGIYQSKGDYEKALEYTFKGLRISRESRHKLGLMAAMRQVGAIRFAMGKTDLALAYADSSYRIAKDMGYTEMLQTAAQLLSDIYFKKNDYKAALLYYKEHVQLLDSSKSETVRKSAIRQQFQYEYEKKNLADSLRNLEENKVKNAQLAERNAQLKQEKTQRYALYSGVVALIIFGGFMYNRFNLTRRQKDIIEQQKKIVEHQKHLVEAKQKEMVDSIRYARRIQRALITSEIYIERNLNRLQDGDD